MKAKWNSRIKVKSPTCSSAGSASSLNKLARRIEWYGPTILKTTTCLVGSCMRYCSLSGWFVDDLDSKPYCCRINFDGHWIARQPPWRLKYCSLCYTLDGEIPCYAFGSSCARDFIRYCIIYYVYRKYWPCPHVNVNFVFTQYCWIWWLYVIIVISDEVVAVLCFVVGPS